MGWAGTNGFRLMPDDPLADGPATAAVSTAAGGHLTSLAYTWVHPDDGPQDGLLVCGPDGSVFWGDSWHQQPEPRTLSGAAVPGGVDGSCEYAEGWRWEISVRLGDDAVSMVMRNAVPDGEPYVVMQMDLRPA